MKNNRNLRINEDGSITVNGTLTFNKSGSGGEMCRIGIPPDFVRALNLTRDNKNVEITLKNGIISIKSKKEE
jgi:hypothetical protein